METTKPSASIEVTDTRANQEARPGDMSGPQRNLIETPAGNEPVQNNSQFLGLGKPTVCSEQLAQVLGLKAIFTHIQCNAMYYFTVPALKPTMPSMHLLQNGSECKITKSWFGTPAFEIYENLACVSYSFKLELEFATGKLQIAGDDISVCEFFDNDWYVIWRNFFNVAEI